MAQETERPLCQHEGCQRPVKVTIKSGKTYYGKWCNTHYGVFRQTRKPLVERFWSKVQKGEPDECWPWQAAIASTTGYGKFTLQTGQTVDAHRLAYRFTHGEEIADGILIMHTCDNKPCCNPAHLMAGTSAQNSADMKAKKRSTIGERNPNSKLTRIQVDDIRKLLDAGTPVGTIAEVYGIGITQVRRIMNKEQWQNKARRVRWQAKKIVYSARKRK